MHYGDERRGEESQETCSNDERQRRRHRRALPCHPMPHQAIDSSPVHFCNYTCAMHASNLPSKKHGYEMDLDVGLAMGGTWIYVHTHTDRTGPWHGAEAKPESRARTTIPKRRTSTSFSPLFHQHQHQHRYPHRIGIGIGISIASDNYQASHW